MCLVPQLCLVRSQPRAALHDCHVMSFDCRGGFHIVDIQKIQLFVQHRNLPC